MSPRRRGNKALIERRIRFVGFIEWMDEEFRGRSYDPYNEEDIIPLDGAVTLAPRSEWRGAKSQVRIIQPGATS